MLQLTLDFLGKQLNRLQPLHSVRARVDRSFEWKHDITVHLLFPQRARRYLLRLQPDGAVRLVIPRRGSVAEGMRFLDRNEAWLLKRRAAWQKNSAHRQPWLDGSCFLFRGEETILGVETNADGATGLTFADQVILLPHPLPDYRPTILNLLRAIAERELPIRTHELALIHAIAIKRVTVRAQKTRWGSCSVRGTISLNWRLIHAPPEVVDYLIIHELMHRREMNHSARYWKLVAQAFPDYRSAERWLKTSRIEMTESGPV